MKRILLTCFMLMAMMVSISAWAQDRTVTGRVTGADDGLPLPQVSVFLKGTTKGAPTDADGNYRISVPQSGGVLVFRYIGYTTQEIDVQNQSIINVQLAPDSQSLGEVVVTGYGVEKKRDITGAISQVRADEIENLPLQSFDKAVQGRIAGVQVQTSSGQPGGSANFLIRGQSSLSSNTPLFIVDGIQVNTGAIAGQASNNALVGLNPEDIETIEVLKDAAAAAIYGAQAANGVVIINTKKGKSGKTALSVSFQGGFTTPLNLYDMMNAQQFAEIKEAAFVNSGRPAADAWARFGNPNDPSTLNNFDWADAIFQTGSLYTANARLSGGDEKTQFYLSVGSELQEAFVIQSDWERQSMRLNVSHQPTDNLSVTANIGISRQNQFGAIANGNFVNGPFQAGFTSQPNSPARDENGNFNPYPTLAPNSHLFGYNILQGVEEERRENFIGNVQASLNLQYKISPAFTFTVLGGIDWFQSTSINERPATIPVFRATNGQRFEDHRTNINWNTSGTLNFNKSYGDHNVSAILGAEAFKSRADFHSITARGFSNQALRLLGQAAAYFGQPNGGNTSFTRAGAFLRGNYNYKSKYYFNATIRRDGSSRFGDQNRVGTFYSVGASWRPIEEDFMSNQNVFNDLKLRLSYGVLGNSNGITNFQSLTTVVSGPQYLGINGNALNIANNAISWERAKQFNLGIDFAILESRISGSIDLFRNDNEDQLFSVPFPTESAIPGGIVSNVGSVRSEGIEFEIQSTNIDAGDFRWTSNFNITLQNNEVLSLPGGVETLGPGLLTVGQPITYNFGVEYIGINPANGREMYRKADGSLTYGNVGVDDGFITGSALADYYGGLTNTFTYKNFTLDLFIQFQGGNEVRNGDLFNLDEFGNNQNNQRVRNINYWKQPGDVTAIGRPFQGGVQRGFAAEFPGLNGTRQFSDGSYARLKNVGLTYNLPKDFVTKIGLANVSVFVQAINLLTVTKYDGIDPEVTARNNDVGGSNFAVFPVGRQYTAGISINF